MLTAYTTTGAARVCRLSPQTVIRCADAGLLKARRLPSSKHRRIDRADLERFMREHGLPLEWLNEKNGKEG